MRVILEVELDTRNLVMEQITEEQKKEYLTQTLFEVCEDWVITGKEPDLKFEKQIWDEDYVPDLVDDN